MLHLFDIQPLLVNLSSFIGEGTNQTKHTVAKAFVLAVAGVQFFKARNAPVASVVVCQNIWHHSVWLWRRRRKVGAQHLEMGKMSIPQLKRTTKTKNLYVKIKFNTKV